MQKRRTTLFTLALFLIIFLFGLSSAAEAYTIRYTYRYTAGSGWQLVSTQRIERTTYAVKYAYYRVQSGDTLYSISRRFNTTVSKLVSLNHLTSTIIVPGQILRVPVSYLQPIPVPQPAPAPAPA